MLRPIHPFINIHPDDRGGDFAITPLPVGFSNCHAIRRSKKLVTGVRVSCLSSVDRTIFLCLSLCLSVCLSVCALKVYRAQKKHKRERKRERERARRVPWLKGRSIDRDWTQAGRHSGTLAYGPAGSFFVACVNACMQMIQAVGVHPCMHELRKSKGGRANQLMLRCVCLRVGSPQICLFVRPFFRTLFPFAPAEGRQFMHV